MATQGDFVRVKGFVEYEPVDRQAGEKTVKSVCIRSEGNEHLIYLTLWPDLYHADIQVGDYVIARGKYSERSSQKQDGKQTTYRNVSVRNLAVVPGVVPSDEGKSKSDLI